MISEDRQYRSPKGEYLIRLVHDGNGNAEGICNYLCTGESLLFFSLWEAIKWMDSVMDKEKFPERTREFTAWAKEETTIYEKPSPISFRQEDDPSPPFTASFIIRVHYRHNATWQGTIQWIEGMQAVHFKSVLELMKLVDAAMERKRKQNGTTRMEGYG